MLTEPKRSTPPVVARVGLVKGTALCVRHGNVSADFITLEYRHEEPYREASICGRCAAERAGYPAWFYTMSPFGNEIAALGLPELSIEVL
jgi:hypothetical protein